MLKKDLLKELLKIDPYDDVEVEGNTVKIVSAKLDPSSSAWLEAAYKLAVCHAPTIYPCQKCNYPVIDGTCCENCKDSSPSYSEDGYQVEKIGWI